MLNYAGQTIREEAIHNKELMGRDRGPMNIPGANEEEGWQAVYSAVCWEQRWASEGLLVVSNSETSFYVRDAHFL